jgi:hypothetical protein
MTEILKDFQKSAESAGTLNLNLESHSGKVTCVTSIQEFKGTPCPNCGNSRINLVRMHEGCKHWAARRCSLCDCFLGWRPKPENAIKRSQQQELLSRLLESEHLTPWEHKFLQGLKGKRKVSPKQQEVLDRIEAKVGSATC